MATNDVEQICALFVWVVIIKTGQCIVLIFTNHSLMDCLSCSLRQRSSASRIPRVRNVISKQPPYLVMPRSIWFTQFECCLISTCSRLK